MFGIPEHMVGMVVWVGISLMITFYCCFCFLFCRRENKEEPKLSKAKTAAAPRRFVEIHCNELTRQSRHPSCYEYPILERTRVPCPTHSSHLGTMNGLLHFHRSNVATVSVIDPQTKLSLNPNITAEEPPPSYDALFP
ncbi:unnamed protein product [Allacma fusca]|uniref:Uncharacterized protein n=1 Tax=Allacma fusca TaxID=39272 RepID=A0A8J2PIM0_9HEXA|nr:unnamed protein product [Allacma fusca]